MNKTCAATFFIALTSLNAYAQEAGDTSGQPDMCMLEPVTFSSQQLMPAREVKVEASRAEIIRQQVALFSGNVNIISDSATIAAQQAQVMDNGRELLASGEVTYQDSQLRVNSDSVSVSASDERLQMDNTDYQLNGVAGHGAAQRILLDSDIGLVLSDVSFTTCPKGDEDWILKASEISIERGTAWGQAKHARFYLGGVPVFYLPYFAFPVSNQRQTGLLFPELTSSSTTGIDFTQPFYWNIAPNYDMTIAPRYMTKRGTQLQTEFRYMTRDSAGQINVEYLPEDQDLRNQIDRYFYRYVHQGQLSEDWLLNVDLNGISDDNYIVDLGSDYYNRADTHLYRTLGLNYFSEHLDFNVHVRDFVIIGDHPGSYRALPEAKLKYFGNLGDYVEFKMDSELAYFDNTSANLPTAVRWHVAPTLTLPYRQPWGELTAEATLFNTYYQQSNVEGTALEDEVNRTLGQGRLFGALYFEREHSWFSDDMTMTLEPKLQYLYTSYEDQSMIGLYDSAPLLLDVEGLFRGRQFTGLDRISDNNQITFGITSRMLDDANREHFVISLGQIFYFDDNQIGGARGTQDRSALAGEIDWRMGQRWYVHSDIQVTTDTDKVERSSVTLEYRRDNESLVQLTHRYVRDLSGEAIDQIGLSASWPIADNWHWVGRAYRDIERSRSIETYFGLQYESCCWAVQVVAQRHLSNRFGGDGTQSRDEYDSGVALQFIFKGMGSTQSSRSMLEDGMFGYRQPYSLN